MLKPEYLVSAANGAVNITSGTANEICMQMAVKLAGIEIPTARTEWQAMRNKEFSIFATDVNTMLRVSDGLTNSELKRIMMQSGKVGLAYDDAIYRKAGFDPKSIQDSPALQAVLLQGLNDTKSLMHNFTKTLATSANGSFQSLLDQAYLMVMSGGFTQEQAIRSVIDKLAGEDLTQIIYPSGNKSSIEAATRRAVITGVNQSIAKLQIARANEMGCKLVEVTSHAGARPTHAVWQGGVYSLEGKHAGYPNLAASTGYGSGDGLCGWNCYHSFFPFFEGLSTPTFSRDPAKDAGRDNDEQYYAEQKQRYYERKIRESKRECAVYQSAADAAKSESEVQYYKSKLAHSTEIMKGREARLRQFMKENPVLERDRSREQVGGFSRSITFKKNLNDHSVHTAPQTAVSKAIKKEKFDIQQFKENAEYYVGGGYDIDDIFTKEQLSFISKNMKTTNQKLYRIESSRFTADELDMDILDMDDFKFSGTYRSFSRGDSVIRSYIEELDDDDGLVIFETVGPVKHFNMDDYAQAYIEDQEESLVGGRFKVVGEDMKYIAGKFVRIIKIMQIG